MMQLCRIDRTRMLKSRLPHTLQYKDSLNANQLKRGKYSTIIQSLHLLPLHLFFLDINLSEYALISPSDPVANERKKHLAAIIGGGE